MTSSNERSPLGADLSARAINSILFAFILACQPSITWGRLINDPGSIADFSMTNPALKDYVLFYFAIPFGLAVIFAIFGLRLIVGMPFLDGFAYTIIHIFAAWWGIDLGCRVIYRLCLSWRPPVHVIIVIGFFLMLVPLTFFYQWLGGVYGAMYPSFAEARKDPVLASWSLAYLLHFLRFSVTALPIFMLGVFGFKRLTSIALYSYERGEDIKPDPRAILAPDLVIEQAYTKLFTESTLPDGALLLAVKAEEHYIHLWSDQGEDLIRYRFQDALDALEPYTGIRTHRSWWVNPESVVSTSKKGRSLSLELDNELIVPVSLAYKEAVSARLKMLDGRP